MRKIKTRRLHDRSEAKHLKLHTVDTLRLNKCIQELCKMGFAYFNDVQIKAKIQKTHYYQSRTHWLIFGVVSKKHVLKNERSSNSVMWSLFLSLRLTDVLIFPVFPCYPDVPHWHWTYTNDVSMNYCVFKWVNRLAIITMVLLKYYIRRKSPLAFRSFIFCATLYIYLFFCFLIKKNCSIQAVFQQYWYVYVLIKVVTFMFSKKIFISITRTKQ